MDLIDLIPNSMSFRLVTTVDITDESQIPPGFTGRVKCRDAHGVVLFVAWYDDGLMQNPGKNHPAYRRFRHDGRLKYEMFYTRGLLHDPTDTTPAVRGYFANGSVHYEERYTGGRRNDSKRGEPAVRKFRLDGTVRHELRYQHGHRLP